MRVEHRLEVVAKCPVDGRPDVYRCTVRSSRVIPVEAILEAAGKLVDREVYQEELTRSLHRDLACEIETVGWHSGVRTTCTAGGDA